MRLINWAKQNKLVVALLLLLLFVLGKNYSGLYIQTEQSIAPMGRSGGIAMDGGVREAGKVSYAPIMPPTADYAPAPEVKDRLVVENSTLSLHVKNVRETADVIIAYAKSQGGYMVTSSLDNPGESPTGNVVIRVPSAKLTDTLSTFRNLSIKVVSENLIGEDVTDQFVDNEARLATLIKTKEKFEAIFDRAAEISDITNVQRELINLQSQIDAIKGQQQFLEKSAQMAKVTIFLSTDELALPYAPDDAWRPEVIFKQAVRSMVGNIREIGSWVIWIVVYAVVWIPVLLLFLYFMRRMNKK